MCRRLRKEMEIQEIKTKHFPLVVCVPILNMPCHTIYYMDFLESVEFWILLEVDPFEGGVGPPSITF